MTDQKPEEIFRSALSSCATNDLMLAVNIVRVMTHDVDPSTNPGLVNLWRSIGAAVRAEIDTRPLQDLVSQDEIDQLNAWNSEDVQDEGADD